VPAMLIIWRPPIDELKRGVGLRGNKYRSRHAGVHNKQVVNLLVVNDRTYGGWRGFATQFLLMGGG
jgi:hypothetical protein